MNDKELQQNPSQKKKLTFGQIFLGILGVIAGILALIIVAYLCFCMYLMKDHWLAFVALILLLAAFFALHFYSAKRFKNAIGRRLLINVCSWIVFLPVALLIVNLGRPDRSVSLMGDYATATTRYNTLVVQHLTPEEVVASHVYEPYEFGSSPVPIPDGYTNELIALPNCNGFLMQKEDGNHNKVVYQIHGGAYVLGYAWYYDLNAVMLSDVNGDSDVFSIDYRTAAVSPYPAALDDAIDGYNWLLSQGYLPENIVVFGDSAGGGLSLAMTLKLRDTGAKLPKCLVLSSPWTDLSQEGESYTTNRKTDAMFGCLDDSAIGRRALPTTYADGDSVYNPYISPVFADYHDMPPMLIQAVKTEMLLSDSTTVAQKAKEAGTECTLKLFNCMWHTFFTASDEIPEQKKAWDNIREFLNK
ncbi:MAG: alpha/beta hydrolase [Lachnospiraceae bacterium]|nr:alpha/beta hydrolase [Lachnospiraceae bacterium]